MLSYLPPEIVTLVTTFLNHHETASLGRTCWANCRLVRTRVRAVRVPHVTDSRDGFRAFVAALPNLEQLNFETNRWGTDTDTNDIGLRSGLCRNVRRITGLHLRSHNPLNLLSPFTNLRELTVTVYGVKMLATLAHVSPTLERLNLRVYNVYNDQLAKGVRTCLHRCTQIRHLTLGCRFFSDCTLRTCSCEGVTRAFFGEVFSMPLETLDLDVPCMEGFTLQQPTSLRSLSIQNCIVSPNLLNVASRLPCLRRLRLCDTEMLRLLPFFQSSACPPLQELVLQSNWRCFDGMPNLDVLLCAVNKSVCRTSLHKLQLRRQLVTLPSILAIAKLVNLRCLELPMSRVQHGHMVNLCTTLRTLTRLVELDLSGICSDKECSWNVIQAISAPLFQWTRLNLSQNEMCGVDLVNLLRMHANTLTHVDISRCTTNIADLLTVVPRLCNLQTLRIIPETDKYDASVPHYIDALDVLCTQAPNLRDLTVVLPDALDTLEKVVTVLTGFKSLVALDVWIPKELTYDGLYEKSVADVKLAFRRHEYDYIKVTVW